MEAGRISLALQLELVSCAPMRVIGRT